MGIGFDMDLRIDNAGDNGNEPQYTIPTNKLCTITAVCPPTTIVSECYYTDSCDDPDDCLIVTKE